jgi:hypothetical protein
LHRLSRVKYFNAFYWIFSFLTNLIVLWILEYFNVFYWILSNFRRKMKISKDDYQKNWQKYYVKEVSTRFDNSCPDSLTDLCWSSSVLCWMQNLILHLMVPSSAGWLNDKTSIVPENRLNISSLFTNWKFRNANITQEDGLLFTIPISYQECNCGLSSQCSQRSKDIIRGCYPLETLLQSTFQYFYNEKSIHFKRFNSSLSLSSRILANTTIEIILNELMLENFSINISYEYYFEQCSPLSCNYLYIQRHTSMYILISLISLYGGLVTILQWIVILILKLCRCRTRQINPQTISQNTWQLFIYFLFRINQFNFVYLFKRNIILFSIYSFLDYLTKSHRDLQGKKTGVRRTKDNNVSFYLLRWGWENKKIIWTKIMIIIIVSLFSLDN